ncbi:hypothetical protein HDV01_001334 [Terramyces sp. JEL0728]|nr:hypothetical protein HDV01_001334 [Terramyces sp. JEL0728]
MDHAPIPNTENDKRTDLPFNTMLTLCIVLLSEPISSTILFPFVYFMVKDFGIKEQDIGFYVGFVSSSYFFAQLLTSVFWGYFSDRCGRRPALLIGLVGNTITMLMFGISTSLAFAIVSRTACGLLNGNIGVAKSVLGEITDNTNRAAAFSIIGLTYGVGTIIGPAIGGILSNPNENLPFLFGNNRFLAQYPYFLPCALSALISIVGYLFGSFYLPETCKNVGGYQVISPDTSADTVALDEAEFEPIAIEETGFGMNALFVALTYAALAFHDIIFVEIFPLWAVAKPGIGLGFDGAQIGICLSVVGVFTLVCAIFLYPSIAKRTTSLTIFRVSSALFVLISPVFPLISTYISPANNGIYLWAALLLVLGIRSMIENFAYTSVMILVHLN